MADVVPPALAAAPSFRAEVLEALESSASLGAAATIESWT